MNLSTENHKLPFQYMNTQKMNEFLERIVKCTEKWRTLQLEDLYFSFQTIVSKPTADIHTRMLDHLSNYLKLSKFYDK